MPVPSGFSGDLIPIIQNHGVSSAFCAIPRQYSTYPAGLKLKVAEHALRNTWEDENPKQRKINESLKPKYRFNFNSSLTLKFLIVMTAQMLG